MQVPNFLAYALHHRLRQNFEPRLPCPHIETINWVHILMFNNTTFW